MRTLLSGIVATLPPRKPASWTRSPTASPRWERYPESGRRIAGDVRRSLLVQFLYVVFYRYVRGVVRVLMIDHEREKPRTWEDGQK